MQGASNALLLSFSRTAVAIWGCLCCLVLACSFLPARRMARLSEGLQCFFDQPQVYRASHEIVPMRSLLENREAILYVDATLGVTVEHVTWLVGAASEVVVFVPLGTPHPTRPGQLHIPLGDEWVQRVELLTALETMAQSMKTLKCEVCTGNASFATACRVLRETRREGRKDHWMVSDSQEALFYGIDVIRHSRRTMVHENTAHVYRPGHLLSLLVGSADGELLPVLGGMAWHSEPRSPAPIDVMAWAEYIKGLGLSVGAAAQIEGSGFDRRALDQRILSFVLDTNSPFLGANTSKPITRPLAWHHTTSIVGSVRISDATDLPTLLLMSKCRDLIYEAQAAVDQGQVRCIEESGTDYSVRRTAVIRLTSPPRPQRQQSLFETFCSIRTNQGDDVVVQLTLDSVLGITNVSPRLFIPAISVAVLLVAGYILPFEASTLLAYANNKRQTQYPVDARACHLVKHVAHHVSVAYQIHRPYREKGHAGAFDATWFAGIEVVEYTLGTRESRQMDFARRPQEPDSSLDYLVAFEQVMNAKAA